MSKYAVVLFGKNGWVVSDRTDSLTEARRCAIEQLLFRNKLNDYAYIRSEGKDKYMVQIGPGGYKPGDAIVRGYYPLIVTVTTSKSGNERYTNKKYVNLDGTFMRRLI